MIPFSSYRNSPQKHQIQTTITLVQKIDAWKTQSMEKMKQKLDDTIEQRTSRINQIVNDSIPKIIQLLQQKHNLAFNQILPAKFYISKATMQDASIKIYQEFENWHKKGGVRVKSCKKRPINSFNDYYRVADNWWNRHKGEWFGKFYFFYVFHEILRYCCGIAGKLIGEKEKGTLADYLTISLLVLIGDSNLTFRQARAQGVIYVNSLTKKQDFRDVLLNFGKQHGVEFTIPSNDAQQVIRDSFRVWCEKIKTKLIQKLVANYVAPIIDDDNYGNQTVISDIRSFWDSNDSISVNFPLPSIDLNLSPQLTSLPSELPTFNNFPMFNINDNLNIINNNNYRLNNNNFVNNNEHTDILDFEKKYPKYCMPLINPKKF